MTNLVSLTSQPVEPQGCCSVESGWLGPEAWLRFGSRAIDVWFLVASRRLRSGHHPAPDFESHRRDGGLLPKTESKSGLPSDRGQFR